VSSLSSLVEQMRSLVEKGPYPRDVKTSPVLIPISQLQKKGGTAVGKPSVAKTAAGKGQGTNVAKPGEKRKRKAGTFVKTKEGDWEKVPEKGGSAKKPKGQPATKVDKPKGDAEAPAPKKAPGQAKVAKGKGRAKKAAAKAVAKNPEAAKEATKALKGAAAGKKPSPEEKKKVSDVAGGIAKSIARTFLKGFYRGRDIGTGKFKEKVADYARDAWQNFLKKIDFVEAFQLHGQMLVEADSDEGSLVSAMQGAEDDEAMMAVIADFMEKEVRRSIESDPEMEQGAPGWQDDDEGGGEQYPFENNPTLNPAGWY